MEEGGGARGQQQPGEIKLSGSHRGEAVEIQVGEEGVGVRVHMGRGKRWFQIEDGRQLSVAAVESRPVCFLSMPAIVAD